MNTQEQIEQAQHLLNIRFGYRLTEDGKLGPMTAAALVAVLAGNDDKAEAANLQAGKDGGEASLVDARSEKAIATLLAPARPYARALVNACAAQSIKIIVLSGLRTYAEQDALFAQGNVTKVRGGYSAHNFGIAFDIGVFQGAKYLEESPIYKAVGAIGIGLGLDWGGNWTGFTDQPHFTYRPRWAAGLSETAMMKECRRRVAADQVIYEA